MRIGFPRAMLFFEYYPFWLAFFQALGEELVTSPPTHKKIMEAGLKRASDDTCLPIKLLAGHLQSLTAVDAVFLPRMVSTERKTYLCPKILGLPESVHQALPKDVPLLTVDVNWREGRRQVEQSLIGLGRRFGKGPRQVKEALAAAQHWEEAFRAWRLAGLDFEESVNHLEQQLKPTGLRVGLPLRHSRDQAAAKGAATASPCAIGRSQTDRGAHSRRGQAGWSALTSANKDAWPVIALVGHPYLTYEAYANLNILARLKSQAQVRVMEQVDQHEIATQLKGLNKPLFWSQAKRLFGAGRSFVTDPGVDGLIYLSCFACGTDSMTQDLLARQARLNHKPYMVITLDEHSGEAGLITRLEAFLDMLERRRGREAYVSAHGQRLDCYSNLM